MGQYDLRKELIETRGTDEVMQAWRDGEINMNGTTVHKVQGGTIFIPLPQQIQRLCGGCSCPWCTTDRKERNPDARWDTLAVHPNQRHAWEVHMPAIHGKPKLRIED